MAKAVVGEEKKEAAEDWFYSGVVKDHFFNPRNVVRSREEASRLDKESDGKGVVGSPVCGDMMEVWIKVGVDGGETKRTKKGGTGRAVKERIKECRWRTFGCASAIASTSMMSVIATENGGIALDEALKLTPAGIAKRLGGLPPVKIHCSVLGDQALHAAVKDYLSKQVERQRKK